MNGLDLALLAVVGLSTAIGAFRGFVREVIGLAGIGLAGGAAYLFAPQVAGVIGEESALTFAVATVLIFITGLIGSGLIARALSALLDALFLGGLNRFLGGAFGFARAIGLTAVGIVLLVTVIRPEIDILQNSRVIQWEAPAIEWMGERLPFAPARDKFIENWSVMKPPSGVHVRALDATRPDDSG